MQIKTLLLGSAAAMMVAGGAQAADLSIGAEPVDYVRVCDAFGVGYWYIPGTDTCLKIGGRVRFQLNIHEVDTVIVSLSGVTDTTHSSHWRFTTNAQISVDARSMTEYGELRGYVKVTGTYDDPNQDHHYVKLDEAWLQLGHITAGKLGSVQDTAGGYDDWGGYRPDVGVQQVRLTWAAAGFGLMLGIEDPRLRWGTALTTDEPDDVYSMPDITGRLTASLGHVDARLTAGFGQIYDSADDDMSHVYGVAGTLEAGDSWKIRVGGAFGTGRKFVNNSSILVNHANNWGVFASLSAPLGPTLTANGTVSYTATDGATGTAANNQWGVGANLVWAPVAGFHAMLQGTATKTDVADDHVWNAFIRLQRDW